MPADPPSLDSLVNAIVVVFNKYFLIVIGMVSVATLIFAGFMRMMAGENSQNLAKANTALMWSIIGLAVSLGGIFITKVFIKGVIGVNIP